MAIIISFIGVIMAFVLMRPAIYGMVAFAYARSWEERAIAAAWLPAHVLTIFGTISSLAIGWLIYIHILDNHMWWVGLSVCCIALLFVRIGLGVMARERKMSIRRLATSTAIRNLVSSNLRATSPINTI